METDDDVPNSHRMKFTPWGIPCGGNELPQEQIEAAQRVTERLNVLREEALRAIERGRAWVNQKYADFCEVQELRTPSSTSEPVPPQTISSIAGTEEDPCSAAAPEVVHQIPA